MIAKLATSYTLVKIFLPNELTSCSCFYLSNQSNERTRGKISKSALFRVLYTQPSKQSIAFVPLGELFPKPPSLSPKRKSPNEEGFRTYSNRPLPLLGHISSQLPALVRLVMRVCVAGPAPAANGEFAGVDACAPPHHGRPHVPCLSD